MGETQSWSVPESDYKGTCYRGALTTTDQQHQHLTEQMGQNGDMTYSRKNGNQQAMKEPIIIPEIEI